MRRLLLSLAALAALASPAAAQCVAVGGVNSVPQVGVTCPSEPTVPTYGASGVGIVPVAAATDIACLTGSATKTIRIQRIRVSGTAGTLISVPVLITKHTVANTGGGTGTGTQLPVPFPFDTSNPTVTATATSYITTNPTVDATANIVAVMMLGLGLTGTTLTSQGILFDWDARNYSEAPTIRGVAQQICVNLNGTSPSSGLVNVSYTWTESSP